MSSLRPQGFDGTGIMRTAAPGDVLLTGEIFQTLSTAGAGTLTAALLAGGIINRTGPGAGYTDTTDTSTNILRALAGQDGNFANVLPGSVFRCLFINTVAFAMTFAAGAGVIAGANVGCAASSVREWAVSVVNATPQTLFGMDTANASPTLAFTNTGLSIQDQLARLDTIDVGMTVTGANIPAGTTITGINFAARTVTLSANATATVSNVPLTFLPTVRFDGLRTGTL